MDKCHAEEFCRGFPNKCGEYCVGYIQMQNIYAMSNIPKQYVYDVQLTEPGRDLETYIKLRDWRNNIVDNVQKGRGLYLYSANKGNGKTTWATKMLHAHFRHVALRNNLRCRGLFVPVPWFLQELRKQINNPTEDMRDFEDNIFSADIVVWDDIGVEIESEWVRERMYTFINYRESNLKSQIFTSNVNLDDLGDSQRLGDRVADRIWGQCDVHEFVEQSRRRK